MNNKRKKSEQKQKSSKNFIARLSYISVGIAAVFLVAAFVMTMRFSDITEHLVYQTPMPLPTAAPVFAQTPAPPVAYNKTAEPTQAPPQTVPAEPDAAAVFKEKEPLVIMLPIEGEILKPFSMDKLLYAKSMGDWRVHNGLDIKAEKGTEVKAAATGIVQELYKDALLGYTAVLSHEGGYETLYQNLASTEMLTVGQRVEKGQGIGAVGDSAPAEMLEEAHLHFALKEGDAFANPLDFVEKSPS